jgi:hypothetical protein
MRRMVVTYGRYLVGAVVGFVTALAPLVLVTLYVRDFTATTRLARLPVSSSPRCSWPPP